MKKFNLGFDNIKSEDDLHRASIAFDKDGHYPAGMSDCFVVGLNGSCGLDCPVFRRGDCTEPHTDISSLCKEEQEQLIDLYPENTFDE